MILHHLWAFVFLSAFISCREPDIGLTQSDRKMISDSIRQTLNNYFADIKKEGLTAEFKYLDSSSDFFWVPPRYKSSISYDSIAAILKTYAPFYQSTDNSWETLMINPLSHNLASYSGRIQSITTDSSGKVSKFTLIETGLVIKRETGWKLLNGQTSVIESQQDD